MTDSEFKQAVEKHYAKYHHRVKEILAGTREFKQPTSYEIYRMVSSLDLDRGCKKTPNACSDEYQVEGVNL